MKRWLYVSGHLSWGGEDGALSGLIGLSHQLLQS